MSREQSPSRHSQVKVTAVINSDRSEVSVENDGHTTAHISLQDEDNTITFRSDKDNGKKTEGISESSDSKSNLQQAGDHDQSDAAGPSDAGDVQGGGDFGDDFAAAGVDRHEKLDTEEKDDKKEETQIDSADVIMKLDADINETHHEIEAVLNSIRTNRPGGELQHY